MRNYYRANTIKYRRIFNGIKYPYDIKKNTGHELYIYKYLFYKDLGV